MTTPINIGALTAATTIADTDLVPLVQAGVTKRVDVGTLRGPQVTGGGGGVPGTVALDSFSGTDEAKLTAAMSYAGAQTYAPTILLGNRLHQFSTTRATYEGFRIQGPPGPGNAEKSAKANNCRIELNGLPAGAAWLDTGITTGERFNLNVHDLAVLLRAPVRHHHLGRAGQRRKDCDDGLPVRWVVGA
jgi:hypothetical protein